jgi:hypothetical protein
MAKQNKRETWRGSMDDFLVGPLAEKAAGHLRDGACLLIHVDDKTFLYRREKQKNTFTESAPCAADAELWLSSNTLQQMLDRANLPGTGMSHMGVAVFERIFHPVESERIRIRLEAGVFGLWQKGYFSVLKAGGPEVASYFARLGQGGFSRMKDWLRKI